MITQYDDCTALSKRLRRFHYTGEVNPNSNLSQMFDVNNNTARCSTCQGAQNAGESSSVDVSCKDCLEKHHCLKLAVNEFESFVKDLPVVCLFCRDWNCEPAYLNRICAINQRQQYCNCSGSCSSRTQSYELPSEFLVPPGMPYSINHSTRFGLVFCTPFFSVIPVNIGKFPKDVFSSKKLNLSRVIHNHVFRHELAFNPNLLFEPSQTMCEISGSSLVWVGLRYEIADLMTCKLAKSPFPLIAEMLEGLKSLMLSLVPIELSPYVSYFYDSSRLSNRGDLDENFDFNELVEFSSSVLKAYTAPRRKIWLCKMREHFASGQRDVSHFVQGIKTTIALLNVAKIDRINGQSKLRVEILRCNTAKMERLYYRKQIQSGKVSKHQFTNWLRNQPRWNTYALNDNFHTISDPISAIFICISEKRTEHIIDGLITGFIVSFLSSANDNGPYTLFSQDKDRIHSLQRRISKLVYSQAVDYVRQQTKTASPSDMRLAKSMLKRQDFKKSGVYLKWETRILRSMSQRVYQNLKSHSIRNQTLRNSKCNLPRNSCLTERPKYAEIVQEISLILLLHWFGAGDFYEID